MPAAQARTLTAENGDMTKTRVLIVDDDVNLSRLSAMILENSGSYEVLTEKDSRRALAVARQFQPEITLLDVDMPHKDGGDLAREMKADPILRAVPVLFLTGLLSKSEAGEREIECGGMPFLAKPVMPEVLLASVSRLVGSAAA
ncbi:MAG: two-component system response regulator [Chthoniobacterales bacterium]